ncbi:hypothetical protein [Pelagicoccus sp. SDUM812005]|uniref:hypothetical protein n=1 Tax=Pelagicoccus sp. SDUM812005 TaxID=3041257 RepID=UPI00280E7626|nr:hypothetical protein [Pelagicoccus sp. SDUM812005]MDQ8183418.1 hypothetical protein [Pelagicoccus sp. SDUM812005]
MKPTVTINETLMNHDTVILKIIEYGPWTENRFDLEYERFQERVYNTVLYATEGYLLKKEPKAKGKKVIVRVECSDLPMEEVTEALNGIDATFQKGGDNHSYLVENENISGLEFETFDRQK